MPGVEVKDVKGNVLGKVRIGDTKLQALERLGCVGGGGLFDNEDLGLLDADVISEEKGPYVFKLSFSSQQQQQQQQQQPIDEDDDNILGKGVYEKLTGAVCFFQDDSNRPIGAGFAVSETAVFSVAHNFVEPAVGMEITCYFGKPHHHVIRQLRLSSVDIRLDYCILNVVPGEVPLPNFLDISTAPLKPGKQCILAAFQIGIQKDLQDIDPEISVGVFKGEIAKLYPRHFVYQCPSFAGDSGGAVVLKDGRVIGIHQETVIQATERIQRGAELYTDSRLDSVEESLDELLRSLSSGSIGLQLSAIPESRELYAKLPSG